MAFPFINGTEVLVAPPDGYQVDFANPARDTSTIEGTYWAFGIMFPVAFLFLSQRIYTGVFILGKWRVDDTMLVLAWLMTTVAQCLVLHCLTSNVLGVHIWEISIDDAIWETTMIHATTLTVIPGTVLAKLVLCIFYYRLSPITWYRHAISATAIITITTFAAVWFSVQFACKPIEAAWNLRLYTGSNCIDRPPVYMLQAVMGGVTDIMLMVLPLPIILKLQMSWKHKVAVIIWFGTGLLTLGAALARLVILVPSLKNADTTYVLAQGTLWLVVEANLIIICGALPTFRIFLDSVAPWVLRDARSRNATGSGGSGGAAGQKKSGSLSYGLRTFGSGPKRRMFDTIDELEFFETTTNKNDGRPAADSRDGHAGDGSKHSDEEAIIRQ
ncbi:alpha-methylacyl-CoA racemase [Microdochium nivale]|nr:alpha-methylacyl-CoA racemase [Microdochium nivale]